MSAPSVLLDRAREGIEKALDHLRLEKYAERWHCLNNEEKD